MTKRKALQAFKSAAEALRENNMAVVACVTDYAESGTTYHTIIKINGTKGDLMVLDAVREIAQVHVESE
jgi:hypothetical protein